MGAGRAQGTSLGRDRVGVQELVARVADERDVVDVVLELELEGVVDRPVEVELLTLG